MKTRNVDLEHSSLLTNHICKHIVLEAPTIPELEKKIKHYETLLVTAITNAYRITNLKLDYDGTYNFSPNQNYQVGIFFNFNGKRKDAITHPEATLHHLKQLASLTSKKHQTSHIISPSTVVSKKASHKTSHIDTILVEANSEAEIDETISNKQRDFIRRLISTTNLTDISFSSKFINRDSSTGKIRITISVQYKVIEIHKKQEAKPEER